MDELSWAELAREIQQLLGARSLTMWCGTAAGPEEYLHVSPSLLDAAQSYAAHYHRTDLWSQRGMQRLSTGAMLGQELASETEIRQSEFYNDFARPLGMFHCAGAVLPIGGERLLALGCHRPEQDDSFSEADRDRLDVLLPHLRRAMQMRRAIRQAAEPDLRATFHAMPLAALVLDGALRVVRLNARAEVMLHRGAIRIQREAGGPGQLALHRQDTGPMGQAVRKALLGDDGGLVALRREGGPPLLAEVMPLPAAIQAGQGGRANGYCLVILRDGQEAGPPRAAQALMLVHGLLVPRPRWPSRLRPARRPRPSRRNAG